MPKEILDKLMALIGAEVPTEALMSAENTATFLDRDRALNDIRKLRCRVVEQARCLAIDIDHLRIETAMLNGMDGAVKYLLKPAPVERFPASDEQPNTL